MEDPQDALNEELHAVNNMLQDLQDTMADLAERELRLLRRPVVRPHHYHHQPHQPHYPQEEHPQQPQDSIERHINVQCDECGEDPILGIRYKSLLRRNYDVCERCLQENHNGVIDNNFVAFTQRVSIIDTRSLEPTDSGRSITVYSFGSLAEQLDEDPKIEDVTFYIGHIMRNNGNGFPVTTIRDAIAKHPGLKCLHVYIRATVNIDETVVAIAEGLKASQSVQSVSWSIGASTRRDPLGEVACQALRDLMEHNRIIRFMFVKRPFAYGISRHDVVEDNLCDYLFDGLVNNATLQTFRYVGCKPLKDRIKNKAWYAMEFNPSIRRIEANFENSDCQLDILSADKKHNWMERWAAPEADSETRLNVLKEVQTSQLDAVPALYHFIRNQPGFLIENYTG